MIYIEKLEIQYFRSVYTATITNLNHLNVFTGKNDVGKSNILKALNLFFNNEVEDGVPFSFEDNFNKKRLEEVRKDSIKGKQYIQIKVTFHRGSRAERTLPERFTVVKKWLRNDSVPSVVSDNLERQLSAAGKKYSDRSKSSLTALLNRIRFIYVPAIKDDKTFGKTLQLLRESIYNDKLLSDDEMLWSMSLLAERISNAAQALNEEFSEATGISTSLSSPKEVSDLYRSINVDTKTGNAIISLNYRGDGIRVRYLPSILNYIAANSNNFYIWGFEEPENSLEYNLALQMAQDFANKYCKTSMIFLTTHSPAFLSLETEDQTTVYRCFKKLEQTRVIPAELAKTEIQLSEELGYIQLQKELYGEYNRKIEELDVINSQKAKLETELLSMSKPVLYTEGFTDVLILQTAWSKLHDQECPFFIKSCNVLDEGDGSAAGCSVLKNLLQATRPDNPFVFIGLFDRDQAGMEQFRKLDANFLSKGDGWKAHRNGKSHAMLLPVPAGKECFAEHENLCIEFFFDKADLEKEVAGKKLILEPEIRETKIRDHVVTREPCTELYYHTIKSNSKMHFAKNVVPILAQESFVHFKKLFEFIGSILKISVE